MQLKRKKRNEEMKNKMKGSFASRFGKIVGVNIWLYSYINYSERVWYIEGLV